MSQLRTFRVTFTDLRRTQIRIKACSAAEAIKRAERAYLENPNDIRVSISFQDSFVGAKAKTVVTFEDLAIRHGAGGRHNDRKDV